MMNDDGVEIIAPKKRGMHAGIFRDASMGRADCTNGGITGLNRGAEAVIVFGLEVLGFTQTEVFEPNAKEPTVVVEPWHGFCRALPCDENGVRLPGQWAFGGNYISTSDSRFPQHPVPVHDHQLFKGA